MVKTYKNLYESVCSFENLFEAYLKARRRKRYRQDVLEFSYNLEENLIEIKQELENQTYKHGSYRKFYVHDQKRRLVKAAPFKDRVMHHALCDVIEPIFDKTFIFDSYSCRKGKGTHFGADRLTKSLRRHRNKHRYKELYALKCDIRKYFDSIDHEILLKLLSKKIKDEKVMWLLKIVIDSSSSKGKEEGSKGIPIGNLTSQLFANVYLNELDYFVRHALRIKYYFRYMDDFVILHESQERLYEIKGEIKKFLKTSLKLEVHPKKQSVCPVSDGIDFLGYRIFYSHRLVRKSNIKRFVKRMKTLGKMYQLGLVPFDKIRASINSWLGYVSHADSFGLRKMLLGELGVYLPKELSNEYRFECVSPTSLSD